MLFIAVILRSWNFIAISIRASAPIVNRIILHFRALPGISSKSTVFFLAAKHRVLQAVMPNVHTFSSFSRSRFFSKF